MPVFRDAKVEMVGGDSRVGTSYSRLSDASGGVFRGLAHVLAPHGPAPRGAEARPLSI